MLFSSRSGGCDWIIAGLGNPGLRYAATRHNAGYRALDLLAEHLGAKVRLVKFEALTDTVRLRTPAGELRLLLMKPTTFMNLSGRSVSAAVNTPCSARAFSISWRRFSRLRRYSRRSASSRSTWSSSEPVASLR